MEIKNVLLSIKPKFALQIIGGTKTIELRRKFPTDRVIGGIAIIYASNPLQKIIGYAHIENVLVYSKGVLFGLEFFVRFRKVLSRF